MATVRVNGVDLRFSRFANRADGHGGGGSEVVVIIHGLTVDHSGMSFTLGMPLSVGAEVVLYDLRGHGRSEVVGSGYRIADHVADLIGLLDALEITTAVHLVGCSYGGVIALHAAAANPQRVASLTLLEALLPYPGWGEALAQGLEDLARQLVKGYTVEQVLEFLGPMPHRRAMGLARRAERLILETSLREDTAVEPAFEQQDYDRVRCPVQAIYGDQSHVYWLVDVLRSALPDTAIHVVPDVDHMTLFLQTRTIKDLIKQFVGSAPALTSSPLPGR